MDVKSGAKIWVFGVDDETLIAQLSERTPRIATGRSASECDVVFVQVNDETQLARINKAASAIMEAGAIWVVHPKGKAGVADTVIFARAAELGLTYTKVARISETLTAEKLVKPVASRKPARR